MRYEDTSGSISSSATPEAHSDADVLPNGSNGPATGNVITGAGTTTGKAGADTPASGHVVEVRGASGSDTSADGAKMSVDGRFGTLAIDDHGNYKYVADGHAPQNFRDIFQYTLANAKGDRSMADLVISRGGEIKVADNAQRMVPGPDGVVTLPEGVNLNNVHVVGRDLVVDMPDGSQIVIVDGAVFVPQLVLGGVEVPATNLAALMIDTEAVRTVAGPPQSSGGNFDVPVPPLDPGVPLGDLIPPTELIFGNPVFEEIGQFIDREPEIEIQPENQTPSVAAQDSVNEAGLPSRNGNLPNEPAGSGESADGNGSNNSDGSETTTGTIIIDSPDDPNSVTINGFAVTGVVGQVIPGTFGNLTITGFNGQNILYSYTLRDNTSGNDTHDDFSVTVTDNDGDQASATLRIDIVDDVPTARPDTDSIPAGQFGPATGNVITDASAGDQNDGDSGADTVGADNASITSVSSVNVPANSDNSGPFVVNGQYGVLTLQTDGSYSYTRNPGTPGGVNDVFNYTLTDGDGDTSTTTLTISIGDAIPQTGENPLIRFDDDALPGGNPGTPAVGDDSPDTINAAGTLAGSGGDGPITFAVSTSGAPAGFSYVSGGAGVVLIQQNGHTVLTVTVGANGSYSVVQNAPIDHAAGNLENNQVFTLNYTVTDQDGDSAPGSFTINVDDDTPIVGITEQEPSLTVDETNLAVNASADFSGAFTHSFGADGPAAANSLVYSLGIFAPGADSGLVDVATGQAVVLVLNNGVVEGHVGNAAGAIAFVVSVDASGTVTLDQQRALTHPDASNPDDNVTLASNNLITLTLTATDHDADSASRTLNIGQHLNFHDDGPSIQASETQPVLTVDETVLATNATADFSGVFTHAFGADGAGTVTYALGTAGGASGLTDTLTGESVILVNNNGVIEGRTSGGNLLVFTVSIDASGNVTLDQVRAVVHADTTNPDDARSLSSDGAITITATVTDRDGDQASAVANIGQNLVFEDDGPSITTTGTEPSLTVDETILATNASASFAGAFAPVFGADGPGSPGVTYALSINAGATGLVDVATGLPIVLVNNAGVIEGHVGVAVGPIAFTVSVNAAGTVTLDQIRALQHPDASNPDDSVTLASDNLVVLTATVHDGDGDTASAALNIGQNLNFEDDGPQINANGEQPSLLVDETNLAANDSASFAGVFISSFGADGAGTIAYALGISAPGVASGLIDVATGSPIVLVLTAGGVVEGHVGSAAGAVAFTVSIDANSGVVTLDQIRALQHPNPNNPDDRITLSADSLVTITATITDRDGDQQSATANIGQNLNFDDDGPNIQLSGTQPSLTVDETVLLTDDSTSFASAFTSGFGADGAGSVTYALSILSSGAASGLVDTLSGQPIILVMSADGTFVEGRVGNALGAVAFTVTVNSTGVVTLDQQRAVIHPNQLNPDDSITLSADNLVQLTATVTDRDGDHQSATLNIGQNLNFEDDGPTARNDTDTITNGGTVAQGNVITGVGTNEGAPNADSSGADSPAHVTGIQGVSPLDTTFSGGFLDATGVHGTLQIDANGNYTYNRTDNVQGTVQDTFTYTLTDADGDSVTATLIITMTDNAPNAPGNVDVWLDDDALANGNPGGTGDRDPDTQNTSGNLVATGGDGDLDYFISASQNLPTGFTSVLNSAAGVQTLSISQNGTLVLTVTLTNETGAYTVTQNAPIVHALDGNTEGEIPVGNLLSAINVAVFAQDADGDPSPNGTIVITVDDDTPTVSAPGVQPSLTVDETVLATNDSASFAGVFTHSFGADGPALANSITYALGVNAGATGLIDVATGSPIVLVLTAGGVVEGHVLNAGGPIAFTVSVNGAGTVTLDQQRALTHPDTNNPDDSVSLANDNLITLTQTVTDRDGDQASATANIGQNLNFEDDGPSISTTGIEPTLTVDETILATDDTKSFAANFSSSFGADGAGTLVYALSITGGDGTASGLTDVATGSAIVLVKNAVTGAIEGHVGNAAGAVAFVVSVDASGNVTLDQQRALTHPNAANPDDSVTLSADNLVVLTATITDRDGDHQSASLNIGTNLNFEDDGPTVTGPAAQSSVSVDETSAANAGFSVAVGAGFPIQATSANPMITATTSFGADGAGAVTYGIAIVGGGATTLQTAVGNFPITLVAIDAQTIQGQYTNGGTQVAFTVHINANGTVTLTENVPLEHNVDGGTPADFNDTLTLSGLINATVTVTDKDGDSVTSSPVGIGGNISFFDDGPHAFTPDGVASLNGQQPPVNGNLNVNMGADGLGGFIFTGVNGSNAVDDSGNLLKVGGVQLHVFGFGTNHIFATTTDVNGVHAYDVTLNADGTYTFDVNAVIDNGTQTSFTNLTSAAAGNVEFRGIGVDVANNNASNTDVLLSGHGATQAAGTVNTDSDSVGVDNQSIDPGEGARIDFVQALVTDGGQPTGFNYTTHVTTTHFEELIPQVQGSPNNTVSIVVNAIVADNDQVFDNTPANGLEAGESRATITGVSVIDINGGPGGTPITRTFTADGTQGGIIVDFRADGTVSISGLQAGDTYGIDTTTPFSAVIVESPDFTNGLYAASEVATIDNDVGFDLGIFSLGVASNGTPINQTYNVTATDSDGDFVTSHLTTTIANNVAGNSVGTAAGETLNGDGTDNVVAGNAGNDTLNGNAGADFLYGGSGNDTLNGGAGADTLVGDTGADTLTGGTEVDTFVLSNAAVTNGAGNVDIITDYAAGEIIDITQILSVTTATNVVTGGFLRLTTGGDLQVDLNGGGNALDWVTVGHLNGALGNTTVKYDLSDGTTANVVLTPVAPAAELNPKSTSQVQTVTNSNNVLMGAFAAAGLMASEQLAASTPHVDLNSSVSSLATAAYHTQNLAPIALDSAGGSHAFDAMPTLNFARPMGAGEAATYHSAPEQFAAHSLAGIGGEAAQPAFAAFAQGTAMPGHDGGALPAMAPAVAMPSAAQLVALGNGSVGGVQHNQVVGQVLADALHGGGGAPVIEAALNALPGHGGGMGNGALEALASHGAMAVPIGDSGAFGGFTAGHGAFTMEAAMVHVDAVQTHA